MTSIFISDTSPAIKWTKEPLSVRGRTEKSLRFRHWREKLFPLRFILQIDIMIFIRGVAICSLLPHFLSGLFGLNSTQQPILISLVLIVLEVGAKYSSLHIRQLQVSCVKLDRFTHFGRILLLRAGSSKFRRLLRRLDLG